MTGRTITMAPGAALAAVVLIGTAHAQGRPAADTAWRYVAPAKIEYLRHCPAQIQLLTTKNALIGIDLADGTQRWQLDGLPSLGAGLLWRCGAQVGVSYRKDQIVAFDLTSGERRWDGTALPAQQEIRGYFRSDSLDLLILVLRTATSDRSVVGVRLSDGTVLWQRDDLFTVSPKFKSQGGVSDIVEYQVMIVDSDTTFLWYVSPDGPLRLDARTGATLWRAEALAGRVIPSAGDYPAMQLLDSVLVIPQAKGLLALDARDGRLLWEQPDALPRRASYLAGVSAGLLVRAGPTYVTVLDPATGTARWAAPLTLETDGGAFEFTAAYELTGPRYYVVCQDRLVAAALETGDTTGLTTLEFGGGEHAEIIYQPADGRLAIASRQNLFLADLDGNILYHRYYKAPGTSFWTRLGGVMGGNFGVLGARYGSASFAAAYSFFFTEAPDSTGQSGYSLVRVKLETGVEAGRIWFGNKTPDYELDLPREQILYRVNDRTLAAIRFPSND